MTVEIESGLEMLANLNNLTWLLPRKYLAVFCRRENLQEIGRGGGAKSLWKRFIGVVSDEK